MPATAFMVTGQVQNQSASPIAGVNIDFINSITGANLVLTGDTTDATGAFTVDVPAGNYRVTYSPPLSAGLAGVEQTGITIAVDTLLPTATLPPGHRIQLQTIGFDETALAAIKANFINTSSVAIFTPYNTSAGGGLIDTVIPQAGAPYTLKLSDVGGRGFADKELLELSPAGTTDLGPVVVGPTRSVSGRIIRFSNGAAVGSVDVDVIDSCGLELKLQGDLSDVSGNFSLAGVTDGVYSVVFRPPGATGLARREFRQVEIGAPLPLGDIKLGVVRTLTGQVVDSSSLPIAGIDLNLTDEAHSLQAELNNDNTTASGGFLVEASDGTYTVDFRPPSSTPYAPITVFGVVLTSNVNLGTIMLGNAAIVSGTVRDAANNAVPGADLDVIDMTAGKPVFTPNDSTDSSGFYAARLAAGTWTLVFNPPPNRPDLGPATYTAETISGNRTLNVVLPSITSAQNWQLYY